MTTRARLNEILLNMERKEKDGADYGRVDWAEFKTRVSMALASLDQQAAPQTIDLDAESWGAIKDAASKSPWIPPQYFINDWVSDVCRFLLTPEEYQDGQNKPAAAEGGEPKRPEFPHEVTVGGYILLEKAYDALAARLAAVTAERDELHGVMRFLVDTVHKAVKL